jgi:hypothetical protein
MRETQLDLEVEGKCEATWQRKLEVKQLKTMQLLSLADTAPRPVFPMPNSGADLVHCETSCSPNVVSNRLERISVYTLIAFCVTASAVLLKFGTRFIPQ